MSHPDDIFTGTAEYYSKYRLPYPAELFELLISTFNLNKQSRVLDLGTGTGQLSIPLASHVKEAVAVDQESEMLEEAQKQAKKNGAQNITWVESKAEDISDDMGMFNLTTLGVAFHWMDQKSVLDKVYELTEKGGGIALVTHRGAGWTKTDLEWQTKRKEIVEKYLGGKRRAGSGCYNPPKERFEDFLEQSNFTNLTTWEHHWEYEWNLDSVVGFLYSTSYAQKKFFGDKLEEFEEELRSELLKIEPSGKFLDKIITQVLMGFRS